MVLLVCYQRESTFVTFGDALSSWLRQPNMATKDRSPRKASEVGPRQCCPRNSSYLTVVSSRRWCVTVCMVLVAALFSFFGFCISLGRGDSIMSAGFGAINTDMAISRSSNWKTMVVLTNAPQLIWTFVYIAFNALLTVIHLTHEFTAYRVHRKTLRVTTPYGEQRTTYWLQLPYTIGVPLIVTSALVHWLISQGFFLVRIEGGSQTIEPFTSIFSGRDPPGTPMSEVQLMTSPAPMLALLVITSCMVLLTFGLAFLKHTGSPLRYAASNSFALAAAAHRPSDDVDAAVFPVKWGCVVDNGHGAERCCFTSKEVR
jgi:hypothetical protein